MQKSQQRRGSSTSALSGDNSFGVADLDMVQATMDDVRHSQLGNQRKEEKKKKNVGCYPLALPHRSYKRKGIRELLKV